MKIFFSGIGGSGMSAIAIFMAKRGHLVCGSDRIFDTNSHHPLYKFFVNSDIRIFPQDGSGINKSCELVVFSTALEEDNPDYRKAVKEGVRMKSRPDFLSELCNDFRTFAVAGTSGKSTSSGMLAFTMQRLGLKPNFIGGGRVKKFRDETNPGNTLTGESNILIIEACESDGSIVNYSPENLILLNLSLDHHPVEETAELFRKVIENTKNIVVINSDDINFRKFHLIEKSTVKFSIYNDSDYRAEDIYLNGLSTEFSLKGIRFFLSLPGIHNIYNSLACISILSELGIPLKDIRDVLGEFTGIDRRFDVYLHDGRMVIDDYAHNPHKIFYLMNAIKPLSDSVCYIFQPHGYGPTRLMRDEYIKVFSEGLRESDHLMLLPIYYAGGSVKRDISSYDLACGIKFSGKSVEVIEDRESIFDRLDRWHSYVIMGARDDSLSDIARRITSLITSTSPQ